MLAVDMTTAFLQFLDVLFLNRLDFHHELIAGITPVLFFGLFLGFASDVRSWVAISRGVNGKIAKKSMQR